MVRIAMVTVMALTTSTFAASHMRLGGGAKVEVARRTSEGNKNATQLQAGILREHAKNLIKEAEKLEKGQDTSSSRPPSGNGTETADERPSASQAGSTGSSTGATGDGSTGGGSGGGSTGGGSTGGGSGGGSTGGGSGGGSTGGGSGGGSTGGGSTGGSGTIALGE